MASTNHVESKQPKPIVFDAVVTSVTCHPTRDLIASGDINGCIRVHSYSAVNENNLEMTFSHHKKSCRSLKFSHDGTDLATVSKDKSFQLIDLEKEVVKFKIRSAHEHAIYSLHRMDRNFAATGDDEGWLKVWDLRQRNAVMTMHDSEDCLTDMIVDPSKTLLLVTSGEGTLTAFDVRKHKMKLQSELMDAGLMSLAAVKDGTKVVCGTEDGVLDFFNWNEWGNISDRFPGHEMSIESIVPVTDTIICTGDAEAIRAVHLFPNRFIGVIGDHGGFPIERMTLSHCKQWLASCSHDNLIKFWDITKVVKETVDGRKKANRCTASKPIASSSSDFFKDLAEDANEAGGDCKDDDDADSSSGDESNSSSESSADE